IENVGTQLLADFSGIGIPKARICSQFLENLGFKTKIIEVPFMDCIPSGGWADSMKILLFGVDNISARRAIDPNEFFIVLDGGTNGQIELFDSCTIRNLKLTTKTPKEIWPENTNPTHITHKNLQKMLENNGQCGQLVHPQISTPFVGLFCASLLISELVRSINRGTGNSALSVQMNSLESMNFGTKHQYDTQFIALGI
ncbi:MAG: hypothetical protein AAF243_17420, partial [Cyanobacteria bacterium P01_A01_bin.137]